MKSDEQQNMIKSAVIAQVEQVIERSKKQLEAIQCPEHGQALKKLEFNNETVRFNIETCCAQGELLVEEAIAKLI